MKKWSPSLFGSLQDTKLCCAVYWCQCTAVGQLYQRTFGFGCVAISLIFWGLVASTILWATTSAISLDNMFNTDALTIDNPFTIDQYLFMTVFFGSLAPLCALASIVCGAVILCQIRQHIRRRDKLQVDLGDADDCCIPFWCGPCAMIQMLRHEGVTGSSYNLCSPTAGSIQPSKSKKTTVAKIKTPRCSKRLLCFGAIGTVIVVALALSAFTVLVVSAVTIDLSKVHNTTSARIRPLGSEEARRRRLMYDGGDVVYRNAAESLIDDSSTNVATVLCPERDEVLDTFKIDQVYARGYPDVHGDNVYGTWFGTKASNPYGTDMLGATHSKSINVRQTLACRVLVSVPDVTELKATMLRITNLEEYNVHCPDQTTCYALFGSEDDADGAIKELSDGIQNATFTKKIQRVHAYKSRGNILLGCKHAADYVKDGRYSCGISALYTSYDLDIQSDRYEDIEENFHTFWLYPEIAEFLQTGLPYGHIIGTYRDAIRNKKTGKSCNVQIDWFIDFDDTFPQNASNTWQKELVIQEIGRKKASKEVSNYVLNFPGWKWSTILTGWFGPFWKDTCSSFGIKDRFQDLNDYGVQCKGRCLLDCQESSSVRHDFNESACPTCQLTASDLYSDGKDGSGNTKWVDPCFEQDWSCSLA